MLRIDLHKLNRLFPKDDTEEYKATHILDKQDKALAKVLLV